MGRQARKIEHHRTHIITGERQTPTEFRRRPVTNTSFRATTIQAGKNLHQTLTPGVHTGQKTQANTISADNGDAKFPVPGGSLRTALLDGDRRLGLFEFCLEFLGVFLGNAFLDLGRSALHKLLGFLQAEACHAADNLDHTDLVVAKTL